MAQLDDKLQAIREEIGELEVSEEEFSRALELDQELPKTAEGRQALKVFVQGSTNFIVDLTVGSLSRVVGHALGGGVLFLLTAVVFKKFEIDTQNVAKVVKLAESTFLVVLPIVGVVTGALFGLYRSLIRQVEAVERIQAIFVESLLGKIRSASDKAGEVLTRVEFVRLVDEKVDELVQDFSQSEGLGRIGRFVNRLLFGRLGKLLRFVIAKTFLRGDTGGTGSLGNRVASTVASTTQAKAAGEAAKTAGSYLGQSEEGVSLLGFAQFLNEKAVGLVSATVKSRLNLLRLLCYGITFVFVVLPLIFAVLE